MSGVNDFAALAALDIYGDGRGAQTFRVAQRLGNGSTAAVRRALNRLERNGWVERDPRSSVNSVMWRPKGRQLFPLERLDETARYLLGTRAMHIWSNQYGAYWKPEAQGYTGDAALAGIWPADQAYREASHCGPEKHIFLESARP